MPNLPTQAKESISLKNTSRIRTLELVVQSADDGHLFVGSKATSSYLVVDKEWEIFFPLLSQDFTVEELGHELTSMNPVYFPVDRAVNQVKMMCLYLIERNLIREIDGVIILKTLNPRPHKFKSWQKWGIFLAISLGTVLSILALFLLKSSLPIAEDFFWSSYLSFSLLTSFVFTWVGALLHEAGHYFMARAFGIKGKLKVSHRLNFLVLETYFPDIVSLPRYARLSIYVAGTMVDLTLIVLLILLINFLSAIPTSPALTVILIAKQWLLLQWLSVIWQFLFYMKTDAYFVVKELLRIENLYTLARQSILNIVRRKKVPLEIEAQEKKIVYLYTLFFAFATLLGISRYLVYHLPILLGLILGSIEKLIVGWQTHNWWQLGDAAVILILQTIFNCLLVFAVIKSKKEENSS